WLVGEGPYRPTLWKQVKHFDLTGQIIFPGSFDDLTDVLQAADLFVLPCYDEVSSTTLLQAMAAEVPVVTTDTSQHRQLIVQGKQGLLVPVRDVHALTEAILQVLADPESAARRAALARRIVQQQYSVDRMVSQHLQLFERLIAEKSSTNG
ncbi:MAG TPA: glycosyltransferase, partial [Woeseiaceae bacterium]